MKSKLSVVMLLSLLCVVFAGCKRKEQKPAEAAPPAMTNSPHSMPNP